MRSLVLQLLLTAFCFYQLGAVCINPLNSDISPFIEKDIKVQPLEGRTLSLPFVIGSTLENQWKISIAADDVFGQQGVLQTSRGAFNPVLDAALEHRFGDNQQTCAEQTRESGYDSNLGFSLSKLSRVGTEFSLNGGFRNHKDPTRGFGYCDEYSLQFLIDQPLLRRFWYNRERAQEMISEVELKAVKWEFLQTMSGQLTESLKRYWDFVFAIKRYQINKETRERLLQLANSTSQLIEGGEMAASQIDQQFAEIYNESRKMTETSQSVYRAYHALLFSMGETPCEFSCEVPDIVVDEFPPFDKKILCWDPHCLEQLASNNRGDLIAARYRVASSRINLARARQDRLPLLNVGIGAGVRNFKNSNRFFSSVGSSHPQEDLVARVTFSYPFGNDRALGELRSSLALNSQAMTEEDELFQRIRSELNVALRNHYDLIEQLHYADQTVNWFEKSTEAEIERLKEGYSTVFVVIDFENRLSNSRIERLRILRDYASNLVDLFFITGMLVQPDESVCMAKVANIYDVERLLQMGE
ncbi:MAG: TolC family protein [Waddliaceae bacterium]